MLFTGEHEHSIDSKQRLAIPSEIRTRLQPAAPTASGKKPTAALYLAPGPNGFLWLWTEQAFERLAQEIEQTLLPDEDLMEFDEATFPASRRLEIDSAGRIRLPEDMIREAGLGNTVMILGMRDHLELRDPDQWRQQRQRNKGREGEIFRRARQARRRSPPGQGEHS